MPVLPSEIPTGLVTGQFYFVNEDNIDADTDPTLQVVQGTVTFTCSAKLLRMPTKQTMLVPLEFKAKFDSQGRIVSIDDNSVGIELPATNSPLFNPTGFTWTAKFDLVQMDDRHTVVIKPVTFQVPEGGTVDLASIVPVEENPGIITVQGPQGAQGLQGPKGDTGEPGVSTGSATVYDGTITSLPSSYPTGVSMAAVTTASGWPFSGTVMTIKRSNSRIFQQLINVQSTGVNEPVMWIRYGYVTAIETNEVWSPFVQLNKKAKLSATSDNGELVSTLPVPTAAGESDKRVIFSKEIPDMVAGDILSVMAEFQVTNDLGYNVMCVSYLVLSDSATGTTGIEISEANGRNVTPGMHHDFHSKVGTVTIPTSNTRRFVNLVAYAASSAATPGATIQVDADYGRLSVIQL